MPRWFALLLLLIFLAALAGEGGYLYWKAHQPHESVYDPLIVSISREQGLDPFLVRALIWRESKFDPLTHGTAADEHGLMQVTPEVGQMWAKANKVADYTDDKLYEPETNIRAGTWYLDRALKHWSQADDPVPFALAEYNAGRRNALKWVDPTAPLDHTAFMDRITYPSTRLYVETIMKQRDHYREELADDRFYKDVVDGTLPAESPEPAAPDAASSTEPAAPAEGASEPVATPPPAAPEATTSDTTSAAPLAPPAQ